MDLMPVLQLLVDILVQYEIYTKFLLLFSSKVHVNTLKFNSRNKQYRTSA